MKRALLAWVILGLVCAPAALAATKPIVPGPEFQVYRLGEVVVSGDHPAVANISITSDVSAQDIQQTHSLTVPEALSYAPGVSVTSGRKNEPSISIHGFDQFESLILIDGVPYYETNYGKLNLNQLPTEMIARIDVIKGAPSVLYGPNAMAGVINIITKQASNRPTFSALAEVGEYGAYHLTAAHGNSLGKFKYWINANRLERSGWGLSDDFAPKATSIINRPGKTTTAVIQGDGERVNSDTRQTSVWAKMGFDLAPESQYFLSAYYMDSSWGFPVSTVEERVFTSRPAFSTFARMDKYEDWGLDLSGEQRLTSSFKLRGKLFYHHHLDDYTSFSDQTYSKVIAVSRFDDYFAGGALYGDWRLHKLDTLRLAAHFRQDSHKERADAYLPFTEALSYTGSLALENEWKPFAGFALVVGVSYDWFDVTKAQSNVTSSSGAYLRTDDLTTPDTKDALNPMAGASYTFADSTRLFASAAKKTRFPTLQQLFSTSGGNTTLEPEESINYTLGVSRRFFDNKLWGQFALFYHDVSDRISRDGPHLDSVYYNYAKIALYGFEVAGEYTPCKDLTLRADYTYLKAKDESDGRVTDDVLHAPEHKVGLRAVYTVPQVRTQLVLQGLYLGAQYSQLPTPTKPTLTTLETSGYFLANFKLVQPLGNHLEAFGFVQNILDRDYEMESGYPGMGRTFWVGLRTMF
ncbi:MAG: TonB-dependent receptor [Thermodesulfobacteriota bacterium]